MDKEISISNKYEIMNHELCQINDIIKNHVTTYNRRFEYYTIFCSWNLLFDNDISIDVKSRVMYTFRVLHQNFEKNLKNKINRCEKEGLKFSHVSEMNITFKTRLDHMTYRHFLEQPIPMVERLIKKKSYKNYELIKTLDDIDRTLHMGPYETGNENIDED